jgi:hypothetical protein
MRWIRASLLVILAGWAGPTAVARGDDAPPAAPGAAPQGALAEGLAALKVRMEARMKEADLLMKAGRTDEALAALRSIDAMYAEGLRELRALVDRGGPGPSPNLIGPGPAPTPRPAPEGGEPNDAIGRALEWLAAHQSPDGGWEAAGFDRWCYGKQATGTRPDGMGKSLYDPGVTGLALCAFLGAGYAHRGEHRYAKVVGGGLRYLKGVQDPEGCFGPRTTQHYIYNHAIASLAMVEAYGLTRSPIYKDAAQKALDFIAICRNPYFVWRYGVKPGDNDTSVTGWMMLVLRGAKTVNEEAVRRGEAAPFQVDDEAFDGIRAWIDKMTDPDYGRVGYIQRGSGSARPQELVDRFPAEKTEAMTAVGVLARMYLGANPNDELVRKGTDLCVRLTPTWNPVDGSIDMYYWHYGTLALQRVGGAAWDKWSKALTDAVVAHQRLDGDPCSFKGSWDPIDPWGPDGGRVYSTALLAMTLEVQQRNARPAGAR